MAKFKMGVTVPTRTVVTSRLGTTGSPLVDKDKGKIVALAADSQYDLAAAGAPIEGVMVAVKSATQDGFAIGSVQIGGRVAAVCNGLQGTQGVGTVAVGDLVVTGTPVVSGTAIDAPLVAQATSQTPALFNWRVVSLGNAGAVGDTCVIEQV